MKNTLKLSVIATLVALLSGCGEDLKPKVAALQTELAKEKAALVVANAELAKEKAAFSVVSAKIALAEKLEADRKASADKNATITVQVGLTMGSGDTKPASNTKVYLTRRKASEYVSDIALQYNSGQKYSGSIFSAWGSGVGKYSSILGEVAGKANRRLMAEVIVAADTDFTGVATFDEIPKGDYFVICVTPLGGGAVLEKRISVSTSKSKVALSNADSLE